ncbi:hypothetical protein BJ165DRAFT_1500711 [Panaeolus papilionaceus]|nr:hypothetical protein BJ165DRAFT_1500711 [Panaeolus papilionaceus]
MFRLVEDPLMFIPVGAWLQEVSKYASTHDGNENEVPAAKIINSIRSMLLTTEGVEVRTSFSDLKEYGRIGPLVTENGKLWSNTFKDMKELDLTGAQRWIKYWVDRGLFRNIANHGMGAVIPQSCNISGN